MKENIFINGIWSYELKDNIPPYIVSRTAYKIDDFIKSLEDARKYAINGWVTIEVKIGKESNKRYAVLDTWEYEKRKTSDQNNNPQQDMPPEAQNWTERGENSQKVSNPDLAENSLLKCEVCGMPSVKANDGHDCIPF